MATAKPSSAKARASARPTRCAPPVTSAAVGIGGIGAAPVSSTPGAASPPGTTFLSRPHLGPSDVARGHARASRSRSAARTVGPRTRAVHAARHFDGEAEINLLEPSNLVAESRRLLKFQIRGSLAHTFFEIGDDGLQIGALVMRRCALRQSEGHVIALVNALQN